MHEYERHAEESCPRPRPTPLYGADFAADPGRVYDHLRGYGQAAPVELAPGVPATLVLGYEAALSVLRDPEAFPKDPRRWQRNIPPDCPVLPLMMYRPNCLYTDGATHARLRRAVNDSLQRLDVHTLREHVEHSAGELIAQFAHDGEADLVTQYARPLPILIFNQMFGCPGPLGERLAAGVKGIFDVVDAEKAYVELVQCLIELVALKRRRPGQDVASWLLQHPVGLTDEEAMYQLVILMGAGTEPEQNLIANALHLLLSDDRFAGDVSSGSLAVDDALDEVLWTDPPLANFGITYPVRDLTLAGTHLPADQPVVVSFTAANNDPATFSDQRAGNRAHLAWSAGPHRCPAQGHARLIATIAIERLLDSLPDMDLAIPTDRLQWRPGPFHRALDALPVTFPALPTSPPAERGMW
ncbi:cytochrome P450 [Actinoallomurus iriomotensis]|uniref:Cytochrome P450 n=1 Tax=Actinoallomurus iriomotensis TaxID=478107 RepID=A0A9W6VWZ6_9ACTN|nr:cytochrome P450 [Actinoallomurus iriomotensis]GLY83330.1 cytochrome P450 [Actinoallomurus iriomotensis]